MTQTAEELAYIYNEIAIYSEELQTINNLLSQLASGNNEVVIGFSVLQESDEQQEQPKTALVQSTMGMIAIPIHTTPPKEDTNSYTWIVNEVAAIRILGILSENIKFEISKLKLEIQ